MTILYEVFILILVVVAAPLLSKYSLVVFADTVSANEEPSKIKARLAALSIYAESQCLTGSVCLPVQPRVQFFYLASVSI